VRNISRLLRAPLSIAMMMLVWPTAASADEKPAMVWMAAARNASTVHWGRLVLKDGTLTFHTAQGDWTAAITEIRHVGRVKGIDRAFEIVTASGATLQLSILGPLLLPEPPNKAMQIIQRAMRQTPAPVIKVNTDFRSVRH
jgi:hypothetical protein